MTRSIPILILSLAVAAQVAAASVLSADLEGMTVGQPVGTGGAALGEPVDNYNCVSTIRDAPFPTICLELDDETDFGTGGVTFEFLDSVEPHDGVLEISVQLWFAEMDDYYVYVREQGGASDSFNTLYFHDDGDITANDEAGVLGNIGTFETGRAMELRITHFLELGTYDLWWDGERVVEQRAHGVSEGGIGGVLMGIDHDTDLDGLLYVDDLLVTHGPMAPNETDSWGGVKSTWR